MAVTGAAGGIGSVVARRFADAGFAVVASDYGVTLEGDGADPGPAERVAGDIVAAGGRAVPHFGDVSRPEVAEELVATAVDTYGRLDALVTCHGIFREGSVLDISPDDWAAVVGNHLTGTFTCVQHAARQMCRQRSGSIVCVTSSSGMEGNPLTAHYAAAKAGVVALVKSTALAVGRYDVNANGIIPNAVTRVTTRPSSVSAQWWKGDAPTPDLGATLAVALTRPEARRITGQVFTATGHRLARWSQPVEERAEARDDWTVDAVLDSLSGTLAGPPLTRFGYPNESQ